MANEDRSSISFDNFVRTDGERLRRVMAARHGTEIGADAANSALAWAWEHWDRVSPMDNPAGYLYRVAQTHARRDRERGRRIAFPREAAADPLTGTALDDHLLSALRELTEPQRVAVLLVHVYGWTPHEIAEITGTRPSTVRSHLFRGLRQLRKLLPERDGA